MDPFFMCFTRAQHAAALIRDYPWLSKDEGLVRELPRMTIAQIKAIYRASHHTYTHAFEQGSSTMSKALRTA